MEEDYFNCRHVKQEKVDDVVCVKRVKSQLITSSFIMTRQMNYVFGLI